MSRLVGFGSMRPRVILSPEIASNVVRKEFIRVVEVGNDDGKSMKPFHPGWIECTPPREKLRQSALFDAANLLDEPSVSGQISNPRIAQDRQLCRRKLRA